MGASWPSLPTYVIFMAAAPRKDCNSGESLHRFVSGFKTRSSQTCQIREAEGGSTLEVHFPSGFVKVSPERTLPSRIHQFDGLHVGKQPGILWKTETRFSEVQVESRGREGGRQQKAGEGQRC